MVQTEEYSIDKLINQINTARDSDPVAFEVGKTLLLNNLESGREFCKIMIPIVITGLGAYFGLLSWSWPRTANELTSLGTLEVVMILVPVVQFLVAVLSYSAGYFGVIPHSRNENLTIIDEYRNTYRRRIRWLIFGTAMVCVGVSAALVILISFLTSSNFIVAKPVICVLALLTAWMILRALRLFFGISYRVLLALIILASVVSVVYLFFGLTGILVGVLALASVYATLVLMMALVFGLFAMALKGATYGAGD
jgi:hypothetical protein